MQMKKSTPVIIVDAIEPVLPFWDGLGFAVTVSVPEGDRMGFAILARDAVEIMYQSKASVEKDAPGMAQGSFPSRTNLFIEVEGLAEVMAKVERAPVVIPERRTSYGAHEYGVRAPCGTVVLFAEMEGEK